MAQDYDKIVKEVISKVLYTLMQSVLGEKIENSEILYPELQYTFERKSDFVFKTNTKTNKPVVYHLEFQTSNDDSMHLRMLVYLALLYNTHQVDIRQIVFYINEDKLTMKNKIEIGESNFSYSIIDMKKISYQKFMKSNIPEEVLLATLCNFEGKEKALALEEIFDKICSITEADLHRLKCIRYLQIFSKLRKSENIVKNLILKNKIDMLNYEEIATSDILFQAGEKIGEARGEKIGE
ncbi:MAG: hypothetical protein EAZ85_10425, partial [Bacteroidetes bacterium]